MILFRYVRSKSMKRWVRSLCGCIHPPIQGILTWQGQYKDTLFQLTFLISAYNVTWSSLDLEEVYTPVGCHFGDGCNTEIFWAKHILLILRYVFGEVVYDVSSYHCGKSIIPLRVQALKKMAIWDSGWQRHRPSSHSQKQAREWSESGAKCFLLRYPTCILLQFFHIKPPPV